MMKVILRTLLLTLILCGAFITFMLTPLGLRFGIAITSAFLPGKLSIQKISGVLIGPLTIDHLRYQNKTDTIEMGQLYFNWNVSKLFENKLDVDTLTINHLHVTSETEFTPHHWPMRIMQHITTWLPLTIHHAQITDIIFQNMPQHTLTRISQMTLQSVLTKQYWNVDFSAAIQEPHQINTIFQLNGTPQNYQIRFDITGNNTQWNLVGHGSQQNILFSTQKNKLLGGSLDAALKINLQPTIQWRGTLHAHALSDRLRDIQLKSTGDIMQHTLSAKMNIAKQRIQFHLNGSLKNQRWQGTLNQLTLQTKKLLSWYLQNPATITAAQKQFQITPLCLTTNTADHICLQANWIHQKLAAKLKINISHFGWIRDFTKYIQIPHGHVVADFAATGNLANPTVSGKLNLQNGSLIFPRLNVALEKISASLSSIGKSLHFTAQAFSNNKPLQIKGAVDLAQSGLHAQFSVTGQDINIANTEEYVVFITPNLNIAVKNQDVFFTGEIAVPRATIQLNDYQPIITLPTHDIIYVGQVIPPPQPFWTAHVDVMMLLGDQIHVKAAGFDTYLNGKVRVTQKQSELFGTGQIALQHGVYNVYGQKLTVSSGSYLDYTDSLLDNPSLNLKASRVIHSMNRFSSEGDFTVGISLRGTVRTPQISFFSDRGRLSQADILSYILLGYDTSSSAGGNTDLLLRAVSAVNITSQGLLGKQNIATQIQAGLGLSELGVESDTTVDALGNPLDRQSAFVVGKNITRRLYMRYSVGLLTPVNVFELGYLLNKNWAVQSDSSSLGNGADVLYTISKD